MPGQASRDELADFLKSRRRQLTPESLGLASAGRRRTAGLRREEVAALSGVSLTWYTWLEQARDIKPSRQVVDAVARTLRLSPAEHDYLRRLALDVPTPEGTSTPTSCPAHVQRLLDALGSSPSYAITPEWAIVGWNRAYQALYPNVAKIPAEDRNLLWLVFTDDQVRRLLVDWHADSRRFLAEFRAEAGPRVHEPAVADVVRRLQGASEHFRRGWASHDLERFASRERRFSHPRLGELRLEHHRLAVTDCPELHLVVYTAAPGTDTPRALDALAGPVSPA